MSYKSAIVDELGEVVCLCEGLSKSEIAEILDNHPEWKKTCVEW